jgi:hypothetical protein
LIRGCGLGQKSTLDAESAQHFHLSQTCTRVQLFSRTFCASVFLKSARRGSKEARLEMRKHHNSMINDARLSSGQFREAVGIVVPGAFRPANFPQPRNPGRISGTTGAAASDTRSSRPNRESNRGGSELETPASHSKQTAAPLSNRNFLPFIPYCPAGGFYQPSEELGYDKQSWRAAGRGEFK